MRGTSLACLALLMVCGCQKPANEMQTQAQEPYKPAQPELFAVDPAAHPSVEAPPPVSVSPAARTDGAAGATVSPAPKSGTTPRTHTVAKGDTLYSLANRYYNDPKRWKDILEANRDQLSGPESLRTGQVLRIP